MAIIPLRQQDADRPSLGDLVGLREGNLSTFVGWAQYTMIGMHAFLSSPRGTLPPISHHQKDNSQVDKDYDAL